ncbi:hypothetical protein J2W54_001297 [Rhodococcus fascians]|uniref:Uncharacterized protein n=2 Tax=root TaxID=1 RepID=A0A143QPI6_RHOFA|nr:hypothetical protein A3Q41_03111 [Rhodococcus fascians]KJV00174.1 hypothetical protein VF34_04217 [Rhodococcus sp. PML026]MDP9637321.1 hypothetical protein [Rhodococcus cercidiphylli]MDR6908252.1 hypothetical protein [Rhodococcus sp. 3258]MDQ0282367.1 hypothetical protein [Rhodococcus fascians]
MRWSLHVNYRARAVKCEALPSAILVFDRVKGLLRG